MSGDKKRPAIKIMAKRAGTKDRVEIGAAWQEDGRIRGFRLADGVKLKLPDGSVLTRETTSGKGATHYVDVFVNEMIKPPSEPYAGPPIGADEDTLASRLVADDAGGFSDDSFGGGNDDDSIPFQARDERWD